MDPLFMALSYHRRRKFQKSIEKCSELLSQNPFDQAAWVLKALSLTEQVYVDEVDADDDGIAESLMEDNYMANVSRPGTSLRKPQTSSGPTQNIRPMTNSGRPLSGFVRPGTQANHSTMEKALKTPRTAQSARPMSTSSGRSVRLGTASMLSNSDGPFINLSALDMRKYGATNALAKPLFEYIFHHENELKHALYLASIATESCLFKDWWWKVQLGKCYYRLGLLRDAEKQFLSSLKDLPMLDTFHYLAKVYRKLDQPLMSLQIINDGLQVFKNESTLLLSQARLYSDLNNSNEALSSYKRVLHEDNMCVEAIACVATHHFYTDQPETALKFYRRLLQMGICNAELYNNIGLCCFFAQQYDFTYSCLLRALKLSTDENISDVWYNIGLVALCMGESQMAFQCNRLALSSNNSHAESFNNLGIVEMKRSREDMAKAFFQSSYNISPFIYEPHYNSALLADKMGDIQASYNEVRKSLQVFSNHSDSKSLLCTMQQHFILI